MKYISYSLFGNPDSFEFKWYLRGVYFNIRMNALLYPGWTTNVNIETKIWYKYETLFKSLTSIIPWSVKFHDVAPKCTSMLWRLSEMFEGDYSNPQWNATHIICRDADAITTYREAQAVQEWVDSGLGFHGITDDPAHTIPIMGGMCGFRVDHFKQTFPEYDTFEKLLGKDNLKDHGSDQNLLMKKIYPKAKGNMMGHFFQGCKEQVKITKHSVSSQIPGVSPKLWESNLCARMIGSPGVVDFELLRFFKRFDNNPKFDAFERQFPDIMYWQRSVR